MYTYFQSTGDLLRSGQWVTRGYAGNGVWKNDPFKQGIKDHGPIPRGLYFMEKVDTEKGPMTIHLTPSGYNEMFGRSGFLVHGDSLDHPGEASDGCIVIGPAFREQMTKDMTEVPNGNLIIVV